MKNDETQLFAGRRMALALWLALLGGLGAALTYSGLSPLQLVQKAAALGDHWWAPIAFITLFTLRTPTFLSSALASLLAGALFGSLWGSAWTLLAGVLSALLGYHLGAFFEIRHWLKRWPKVSGYLERAERKTFKSVLVANLVALPFDVINVAAGSLGLPRKPFLQAAFLGSAPGFVSFVFIGASSGLSEGSLDLRPTPLVVGTLLLLGSIALSEWLHTPERLPTPDSETLPARSVNDSGTRKSRLGRRGERDDREFQPAFRESRGVRPGRCAAG